jgi:DNA polymerase-3 subunit gamma/tau
LEEPPAHVIFVLATTELNKIPDTILSRCQIFQFKRPTENILKDIVFRVAEEEGYEIEPGGAEIIALMGDGAFRNTLGVLQKVLNFSKNKKITKEEVEKITGAPRSVLIESVLDVLVGDSVMEAFSVVQKIKNENLDMKLFLKLLVHKIRFAIILKYAEKNKNEIPKEVFQDLTEGELNFLKDLIKRDKKGVIRSKALMILLEAYQNVDKSFVQELPLEMALVEILGENVI